MNRYKWGVKTFHAWSEAQCTLHKGELHEPHAWDGPYTMYGPYMCWGNPFRKELTTDDLRKQVGQALEGLSSYRSLAIEFDLPIVSAFDELEQFAQGRDE